MAKLYNTKYYHRDLSWLRFNHRVLQEAADDRNPLYERIKFLAIFSSNLDEFFRVRVSDIRQIKHLDKPLRKKLITKPNKVLREIRKQVDIQQEEFGRIFNEQIIPELKSNDIYLINDKEFSPSQKEIVKSYYRENLADEVKVDRIKVPTKKPVFIENEALYLVGFISEDEFILVQVPKSVPRFFCFPKQNGKYHITFIDDIIKYMLKQKSEIGAKVSFHEIKKSRDAELYIEDEFSGNLKTKVEEALRRRETGQATRFLVDESMPKKQQQKLMKALDVSDADIIQGARYHNFRDFFKFPNPTNKDLKIEPLEPLPHPVLADCENIMDELDKKDQLLHFPYQSFEPLIRFVEQAAEDPAVTKLKITIYRAAEESRLNDAIARAAKNGKQVVVFIEVKARFDEVNNLKWGEIFKEQGAKVIYSFPAIKVHSKIFYVEKEADKKIKKYAYIGTGNFNEDTAKVYTDFGLFTSNKEIADDIDKVFGVLEGTIILPRPENLLIAPFTLRETFTARVKQEIKHAQSGKDAFIIAKMNSLEDKKMINLLYQASKAGVKIKLIVRGICCLIPGIEGQSENIEIISIIDRFLEHGRVFIFGNDGDPLYFIGSADWMKRNLNHRIEVVTPVLDETIKARLRQIIDIQLKDNSKARILDASQTNEYRPHEKTPLRSQYAIYDHFKKELNSER